MENKKNTELVPATTFEVTPYDEDVTAMLSEELDGLGSIPFDQVKIPSGGGRAFEVPSDDPDNPDTVTELVGVIVDHHSANGFWKDSFNGGNTAPDCASMDGKLGVITETGCVRACETCPYNQFGSATDGSGKACKNMHRIYLLREGEMLPIIVTLPPTSIKPFKEYLAKRVLLSKPPKRCWQVITKITLKTDVSATGIKYSKAVFKGCIHEGRSHRERRSDQAYCRRCQGTHSVSEKRVGSRYRTAQLCRGRK